MVDLLRTDSKSESKQRILLNKGEMDLTNAIADLIHAQSAVYIYVIGNSVSEALENSMGCQKAIKDIEAASAKIRGISYKTQILSINSTIGAAHAGAKYKGFSDVANDIGDLSKQTAKTADEVGKISRGLYEASQTNEKTMGRLGYHLKTFADSNERVFNNVLRHSVIEENGFIITELAKLLENHADFLLNLIYNPGPAKRISGHHNCALGKWYDRHRAAYRLLPGFESLYEPHKAFHDAAIEFNNTISTEMLVKALNYSNEIISKFFILLESFREAINNDAGYFDI